MSQRVLDQEPDTIAVIPDFPDFLVVGTYSLVLKKGDDGPAARNGSLQIIPFSDNSKRNIIALDRKDFPFGIYDVSFHPRISDMLGVATSDGQLLIYRVRPTRDSTERLDSLTLLEVGRMAGEEDEGFDASKSIITQLQFIDYHNPEKSTEDSTADPSHHVILIAVTTQSGNTNLIKTHVVAADGMSTAKVDSASTQLRVIHRQSYNLEAWTVLPILVNKSLSTTERDSTPASIIIISGGDDSQLLVSQIDLGDQITADHTKSIDLDQATHFRLATDKRTHQAGIVASCLLKTDLRELNHLSEGSYMFLTGSYDEKIRLFLLKLSGTHYVRCEVKILSEFAMPGGVWRIKFLSCYKNVHDVSCLLLIAGHTAGAFIVRLTCTPPKDSLTEALEGWQYSWNIEMHFTQHQSLVYAVAARPRVEQRGMWQMISTSFYDKLICEWEWEDCEWRSQVSSV